VFNGVLEGGMLANMGDYDEDDREADKVWDTVDDYMDERRRVGGLASCCGAWAGAGPQAPGTRAADRAPPSRASLSE
jgi:hypothetical protein